VRKVSKFGNGAFGSRRKNVPESFDKAVGSLRRNVPESFDTAFPCLGAKAVNKAAPLISNMLAELALKETVDKRVAATLKRQQEAKAEVDSLHRFLNFGSYNRKVALRQAEDERRQIQADLELLASHYTLFRGEAVRLFKEEEEEEEDEMHDYDYSDRYSEDGSNAED